MTVCVGLKVNDCLVFAADSASTLTYTTQNGLQTSNVYRHANKVYNLHRELPICAMVCGMGNIGNSSIGTLSKNIRRMLTDEKEHKVDIKSYTVEQIVNISKAYLYDQCYLLSDLKPTVPHTMEFYVGGYSSNSDIAEIWSITITNGDCNVKKMCGAENPSYLAWSGQPEAINRLVLGYSASLPKVLKEAGADDTAIQNVLSSVSGDPNLNVFSQAMPIQDAIDLADFLVDVTKGWIRFLPGLEVVGGDTDICTVTKHEGFKWIRRKHFYHQDLNKETMKHGR